MRSEAGTRPGRTPERAYQGADAARNREPETGAADQRLDAAMIRETPNGLLLLDPQGRIRRMNPAARRMLPIRGEPRGLAPIECIPLPALQEVVDDVLQSRAPSERGVQVDGVDLLVRAIPLAEDSGVMAIVLDVSSVRAAERARRDFVANVSHELRTPVTAILGWSEALAADRETLPESARPMVAAIDRNARRLGRLIEDVLALSRLEARRADLPLRTMVLSPLVEEVLLRHASIAASQGVVLDAEVPDAMAAMVDAAAFEHALGNLVDNALKHTPSGGGVRVYARVEDDLVRIDVVDTGVGIAEVHHARIFERFYRVDTGRDRAVGGTGLGLALVKHLCHAMHADVSVASAPGEGSTFTIRLRAASS
jgi:signal transduction histidine kinase